MTLSGNNHYHQPLFYNHQLRKTSHIALILGCILTFSCGGHEEPLPEAEAPALVSTTPENGAGGFLDSSMSVVFTYDQKIRCTLDAQKGVSIDGGASVDKVDAYGTDLTVSVSGLKRGNSYTVTLPAGTVQGYKTNQKPSAASSLSFSLKGSDPVPDVWEDAATAIINMGVGWNLGNTLESNSGDVENMWIEAFSERKTSDYETAWGQPVATRALIHMFKEAGFGAIRVPVTWYPHMGKVTVTVSGGKGHWNMSTWTGSDVDPVWMARVKEVVTYVLDEGMYCILNVHHDTGTATTAWLKADKAVHDAVKWRYCDLWKQIATEFEPFGEKLLFESFNEMLDTKGTWNYSSAAADEVINAYNADFVATVRATGGNNAQRNLVLNTYAASTEQKVLEDFVLPDDSVQGHLMAEVHSYAPYHFAFNTDYPKKVFDDSCDKEVRGIMDRVGKYLVQRGIPCILGEFGADTAEREETELAKQAACYVSAASKYNIACFYWMSLSDRDDRSVPKWTKPVLKDAILKAYRDNNH